MTTVTTPRGPFEIVDRDLVKWPRNSPPPTIQPGLLRGITVHWPGSPAASLYRNATTPESVRAVDERRVGQTIAGHVALPTHSDVGYNYLLGRSGVVWEGRGWTRNGANGSLLASAAADYPAGTAGSNLYWVSIQVIAGTDLPDMTPEQAETLKRFYLWVVDKARIREPRVNGHRDVRATSCPGDVIYAQLPTIAAVWPPSPPPLLPDPTPQEDDVTAQVFQCDDGDIAQFAVAAGVARWISGPDNRNVLDFLGQTRTGEAIACGRYLLKNFTLAGPVPSYPAWYTGPRTITSHFAS